MNLASFPRVRLTQTPTPLEFLANLTRLFDGPNIHIKRDDNTGLALGGNKTRKLEFLIGDAWKILDHRLTLPFASPSLCLLHRIESAVCGGAKCRIQARLGGWGSFLGEFPSLEPRVSQSVGLTAPGGPAAPRGPRPACGRRSFPRRSRPAQPVDHRRSRAAS